VFLVVKAMFRLVCLNNFVIVLISFPVYVNLAHFFLWVSASLIVLCVVVSMFLCSVSYLLARKCGQLFYFLSVCFRGLVGMLRFCLGGTLWRSSCVRRDGKSFAV
jgi:hypothetical protein